MNAPNKLKFNFNEVVMSIQREYRRRRFTWLSATGFVGVGLLVGGVVGGMAVASADYGPPVLTNIQGVLPPPGYTTAYSNTGLPCEASMAADGGNTANQFINSPSNPGNAGSNLSASLGSCLSSISNIGLPGIPTLNLAGLMNALQSQACSMAQGAAYRATSPIVGRLSTLTAAPSALSIPGTGVSLGSGLSYSQPISTQSLTQGSGVMQMGQQPSVPTSIFRSGP